MFWFCFFPEAALRPLGTGTPHIARLNSEHSGSGRECRARQPVPPAHRAPLTSSPEGRSSGLARLSPGAGGASGPPLATGGFAPGRPLQAPCSSVFH